MTNLTCLALLITRSEMYTRAKRNDLPFTVVKIRNRYYVYYPEWLEWIRGVTE